MNSNRNPVPHARGGPRLPAGSAAAGVARPDVPGPAARNGHGGAGGAEPRGREPASAAWSCATCARAACCSTTRRFTNTSSRWGCACRASPRTATAISISSSCVIPRSTPSPCPAAYVGVHSGLHARDAQRKRTRRRAGARSLPRHPAAHRARPRSPIARQPDVDGGRAGRDPDRRSRRRQLQRDDGRDHRGPEHGRAGGHQFHARERIRGRSHRHRRAGVRRIRSQRDAGLLRHDVPPHPARPGPRARTAAHPSGHQQPHRRIEGPRQPVSAGQREGQPELLADEGAHSRAAGLAQRRSARVLQGARRQRSRPFARPDVRPGPVAAVWQRGRQGGGHVHHGCASSTRK